MGGYPTGADLLGRLELLAVTCILLKLIHDWFLAPGFIGFWYFTDGTACGLAKKLLT